MNSSVSVIRLEYITTLLQIEGYTSYGRFTEFKAESNEHNTIKQIYGGWINFILSYTEIRDPC